MKTKILRSFIAIIIFATISANSNAQSINTNNVSTPAATNQTSYSNRVDPGINWTRVGKRINSNFAKEFKNNPNHVRWTLVNNFFYGRFVSNEIEFTVIYNQRGRRIQTLKSFANMLKEKQPEQVTVSVIETKYTSLTPETIPRNDTSNSQILAQASSLVKRNN